MALISARDITLQARDQLQLPSRTDLTDLYSHDIQLACTQHPQIILRAVLGLQVLALARMGLTHLQVRSALRVIRKADRGSQATPCT